jgi:alpha/beta hydrolase fold
MRLQIPSTGYFLTKNMVKWFWDNHVPDLAQRREFYASPLQASIEQLTGLPPAHLQVAGNDMLRDEGVKEWPMRVNSMQPGRRSPGALCRHDPRLRICELSQPDPDRPHSPALGRRGIKKTPQIKFQFTSGDRTVFGTRAQRNSSVTPANTRGRYQEVSPTVRSRPGNAYWARSQTNK